MVLISQLHLSMFVCYQYLNLQYKHSDCVLRGFLKLLARDLCGDGREFRCDDFVGILRYVLRTALYRLGLCFLLPYVLGGR